MKKSVGKFALLMDDFLDKNEWKHRDIDYLFSRLREEFDEALVWKIMIEIFKNKKIYLSDSSPENNLEDSIDNFCSELIDVANFCMMICDNLGFLKKVKKLKNIEH